MAVFLCVCVCVRAHPRAYVTRPRFALVHFNTYARGPKHVRSFWHANEAEAGFVRYLCVNACLRCHLSLSASSIQPDGWCGFLSPAPRCQRRVLQSLVRILYCVCVCVCAWACHSSSQDNMDRIRSLRGLVISLRTCRPLWLTWSGCFRKWGKKNKNRGSLAYI